MKIINYLNSIFFSGVLIMFGCNEPEKNADGNAIVHQLLNKEYVLITDRETLQGSDDEISNHVDSILSGLIDAEFISTGQKNFDLNSDNLSDIGFEIIDLNLFNPNGLPESFDSLAARVLPISIQILDNSTHGYPDALDDGEQIASTGNWTSGSGILGTFMNAGQFQGNGKKYLAIRFVNRNQFNYGWIKIYCSQHNDTLRIIDCAFNTITESPIFAGQTE